MLITTFFSDTYFSHHSNLENSTYILLNKEENNINEKLLEDILSYFEAEYEFSNQ